MVTGRVFTPPRCGRTGPGQRAELFPLRSAAAGSVTASPGRPSRSRPTSAPRRRRAPAAEPGCTGHRSGCRAAAAGACRWRGSRRSGCRHRTPRTASLACVVPPGRAIEPRVREPLADLEAARVRRGGVEVSSMTGAPAPSAVTLTGLPAFAGQRCTGALNQALPQVSNGAFAKSPSCPSSTSSSEVGHCVSAHCTAMYIAKPLSSPTRSCVRGGLTSEAGSLWFVAIGPQVARSSQVAW